MPKTPFDFVKAISSNDKTNLFETEPESTGQYIPFIINRAFSYHEDTVLIANEMNKAAHIPTRMQYDFYNTMVRPRRRFSKWHKPEVKKNADVVAEYYGISTKLASEMVDMIDGEGIKKMKKQLNRGGVKR
jgi:hypothetical protein